MSFLIRRALTWALCVSKMYAFDCVVSGCSRRLLAYVFWQKRWSALCSLHMQSRAAAARPCVEHAACVQRCNSRRRRRFVCHAALLDMFVALFGRRLLSDVLLNIFTEFEMLQMYRCSFCLLTAYLFSACLPPRAHYFGCYLITFSLTFFSN